jgi:hypothetical protein
LLNPIWKTQQNQLRKHKQQSQKTQFRKCNKITLQYNRDSQRHRRIDFRFEEEESDRRKRGRTQEFESIGSRNRRFDFRFEEEESNC